VAEVARNRESKPSDVGPTIKASIESSAFQKSAREFAHRKSLMCRGLRVVIRASAARDHDLAPPIAEPLAL